ncbi:M16 family metallopeptidase [Pseudohoeflea coraliihabitans]|uniref:Insulinase family protein n=1 Tax=Pseudohoeflea coraliihabitans TaxID=2860393 RepID=A0ABS6WLS4_9HYPH|nr:pitrilysin family protein [Pseudohoeflea sp. DP4N28-3]MBW3096922.1 insulinase family protein [Pseudohoeflea sp. DP4N28-3]
MKVRITRLANGLTVATETMAHLESVVMGVWVRAGSRDETASEHGIAHLLEHMAFKGTKRRTARQIAEEIENVGGDLNAATSAETTSFYARVLKDDVALGIDILADILTHSVFDEAELEREKHVILQEIGAANDTPDDVVYDRFTEAAFRDQTIGRPILGTAKTVQSFRSDQIRAYLNKHYTGDRMLVVAAGAVDHDAFVRLVEERFGDVVDASNPAVASVPEARYSGGEYREKRDLMDAQVMIGFEGRAYQARDFYASQVLANILGGGMSSRLFQEVREKRGLCYSVYAFHWGFSDAGLFGVHAATGAEDLGELLPVIFEELARVADHIDVSEIDRSRAQTRAALLMAQESPAARASQIARQMLLFGRPVDNSELMDRLDAITPQRLTDLAGRLFFDTPLTVSAVGPIDPLLMADDMHKALSGVRPARAAAE